MMKKTLIATAAALVLSTGAAMLQPAPAQAGGFSLQIGNAGFGFSIHDRDRHDWRHHRKVRRFHHGRRHCFIRHRKVMVRKWNRWRGCWEWRRVHRRVRVCR